MVSPQLAKLDLPHLNGACGAGAVSRGRIYYEAGRVIRCEYDTQHHTITGEVKGRAGSIYKVAVFLASEQFAGGECTCPVGVNCKHVVAVMLTAAGAAKEYSITSKTPQWQQSLDRLMKKATDSRIKGFDDPNTIVPLGLQFRVDGLVRDASRRIQNSNLIAGISVRPVQRIAGSANWTGGYAVSWDLLRRKHNDVNWPPLIAEWLAELGAMRSQGYWGAPEWVPLNDFPDRLLWGQLQLGRQLGVPFVGVAKRDQVILADKAEVTLDITKGANEVRLSSVLTIDGIAVGDRQHGAIGHRGIYAITEPEAGVKPDAGIDPSAKGAKGNWVITLAPTTEQMTQGAVALLELGSELIIPNSELDAFLTDYLPVLRRHIPMASSDDSIELPETPAPTLVVTATFPKPTTAQLSAHWEYQPIDTDTMQFMVADRANHPIRDWTLEQQIWQSLRNELTAAGLSALRVNEDLGFTDFAAMQLLSEVLPVIAKVPSVRTEIVGNPEFVELTGQPVIELSSRDAVDADWFDLAVTVKIAEREIPLPNLLEALSKGLQQMMLVDGTWLRLNHPSLAQLRTLLDEADSITDKRGKLRVNRLQAGFWDELAELADIVEQSDRWRESVAALHALKAVSVGEAEGGSLIPHLPIPETVSAQHRPYQHQGFNWLAFCYQYGLGGILADDMGLGKTLQAITLIAHVKAQSSDTQLPPFLVVAPASVVGNWVTEIQKFAPSLRVEVINHVGHRGRGEPGVNSKTGLSITGNAHQGADVVITSYAIFRLDADRFAQQEWSALILDEAQFIKNKATKANQAARRLKAPFKLAMTGTPIENNVTELWSILAVVAPGLFPSYERFRAEYVRPIEAIHKFDADARMIEHGHNRIDLLRRRVSPLMLRRTKEQVAPELPERIEQVLNVDLEPAHRRAYEVHLTRERKRVLNLLNDFEANKVAVFRALTTLRRLALDATLIDPDIYAGTPSSKLNALFEQLESVVAEGHRALIFSQFTSYLELVAKRAEDNGMEYAYLTGATRNRPTVINDFKQGTAPLFLISLKAGGFGLNLTEADYVFILDPWWNPAVEAQAVDRTHRIGQHKPVNVFRLVANGTIEEKVMALKKRKAALVGAILQDDLAEPGEITAEFGSADQRYSAASGRGGSEALSAKLTADDIRSLLA